jgi:uncharacterized protein YgfB (UPF0149 family)
MKTLIPIILLIAGSAAFTSCGNNSTSKQVPANNDTGLKPPVTTQTIETTDTATINNVVAGYLKLKDALAGDNGKAAASGATEMSEAFAKFNEAGLTPEQKKVYADVKDDITEHAEHIAKNGSDIEHQREHFDLLSQDIIDFVKSTGTTHARYKDYCPMYNSNKGASWLSKTKDIRNPYLGKKMSTCGEVKEEIKPKG